MNCYINESGQFWVLKRVRDIVRNENIISNVRVVDLILKDFN